MVIIRGVGDNAWKIEVPSMEAKFLPVASGDTISGPKPIAVFGDEIHEMKTDKALQLWGAAVDKMPGDPLMLLGTNTPAVDQTVATELSQFYQRVAEGVIKDDAAFAYIARVDEDDDPFNDESCWVKALPALGITYPIDNVRRRVETAKHIASERLATERLYFGKPVGSSGFWLPDEQAWRACLGPVFTEEVKEFPCFLSLDLSRKNDLTALSACWRAPDDRLTLKTWYWTTSGGLARREAQDGIPYTAFAADKYVTILQSETIDYRSDTSLTTNVRNVLLSADTVSVYLSAEDWPAGIYEIEVIRGATFRDNLFTSNTYVYNGSILDFYGTISTGTLPLTREGLLDRVQIRRIVSIRKQYPINQKNLALIALKARNRSIGRLSVKASGYVRDWDGTGWHDLITTSNPVPHFLDILTGPLNFDPIPEDIIDLDGLLEWRQACIDNDFTCDMVAEGDGLQDILRIIASCGYARPYQSEFYGIVRDYNRSDEAPVQVFSPRNMAGFGWKKAFARVPAGFRVNYRDEDVDYSSKQIVVYRKGAEGTDARTEQVSFDGFVSEAKIIKRASFDLAQAEHRATFYSWTSPAEAIVCRRGSLVAVVHDILTRHYGYALLLRRGYELFAAGKLTRTEFGKRLAQEWASFPVLIATRGKHREVERGQSFYAGDGLNKALVKPEKVEAILDQVLATARAEAAAAKPKPVVVEKPVVADPGELEQSPMKSKTVWQWIITTVLVPVLAVFQDWRVQLVIVAIVTLFAVYAIKRRFDLAKAVKELKAEFEA